MYYVLSAITAVTLHATYSLYISCYILSIHILYTELLVLVILVYHMMSQESFMLNVT